MSIGTVIADSGTFEPIEVKHHILPSECEIGGMYYDTLFIETPVNPILCTRSEAIADLQIWFGRYQNKEKTVPAHEFYNTSIEEIAYIKLTNIGVWTYVNSSQKILSKSYEIELYTATK